MNHIYRIIWNDITRTWVAVAEIARGRGKRSHATVGQSRPLRRAASFGGMQILAASLALIGAPVHALDVSALPVGGRVVAGVAAISQAANALTVQQASQRAALDWQIFNIGAAASVNFNQPSSSAVALNRITGNEASRIYGKLNANGQVFFSNPNGMLFARGAEVNVGGMLATTLNIGNADFMAGNYRFANPGSGSIRNEGLINAQGSAALIGNSVQNAGQIIATTVTLAAGDSVAVDLTGDGLIRARVDNPALRARIENSGSISAAAVTMTAGQSRDMLDSLVNNSGIVRAVGLANVGGEIVLEGAVVENTGRIVAGGANGGGRIKLMGDMDGGTVRVDGTLDASAPIAGNGGFIETSAAHVKVADSARVGTLAANGKAGTWLIDPVDFTIGTGGAAQSISGIGSDTLSTALGSGSVSIATDPSTSGNGDIFVNGAVAWSANNTLTLSAARNIAVNANITATGNTAGLVLACAWSCTGTYYSLNNGAVITLSGSNPSLSIGGNAYTVINEANGGVTTLQGMNGGNLAGRYALGSNIDATATSTWNSNGAVTPTYAGFMPVGTFTGTFDGLGHTITGLAINRPATDNIGLFGYAGMNSRIKNVGLINVSVSGRNQVGGLAGLLYAGTITNSYSTGSVSGTSYVGGLVGDNDGQITKAYSAGTISGSSSAGGLVGMNASGSSTIEYSYSTGNVTGGSNVGGLVGNGAGGIYNTYSTGSVNGSGSNVGGLMGGNTGTISNSYSTGNVTGGSAVGGLVGFNSSNNISNSFWDTVTSSQATSAGGTGKTTAQMKQLASFGSWNIANTGGSGAVWRIYEGDTYPLLMSFLTPLTITANADSKTYDGQTYYGGNGVTYSIASATPSGAPIYSGTSQGAMTVGSYVITPGGYYSNQQGYDISYANGALTINPLTVAIILAGNKVYDGTPTFSTGQLGISNIVGSDTVSLSAGTADTADKNVGVNKPFVSFSGLALTGSSAGNYTLTGVSGAGTITQRASVAWTSGASGNWSTASNWAGGAIPDGANVAAVTIPSGVTVTYDSGAGTTTLNTLTSSGGNLTIAGGTLSATGAVSVAGIFTMSGGTWRQVASVLPAFNVTDFRMTRGTFIRALAGDGGADAPYQLADIYGVQGMGSAGMLGKAYVLANNIDAAGTANWNAGAGAGVGFMPVGDNNLVGLFINKHTYKVD
jgi:filamentous hemagglutinin family protein